jgi:phosphoglycolate phosphatase-like HAD superfamily hydrolase
MKCLWIGPINFVRPPLHRSAPFATVFSAADDVVERHDMDRVDEKASSKALEGRSAFLFDLDGTLLDSVYQHVLAWREALEAAGIELAVWRIHRQIGMSGGLFVNALLRETDRRLTPDEVGRLQELHADAYKRQVGKVRALPGARDILTYLSRTQVPYAIATSGRLEFARLTLRVLDLDPTFRSSLVIRSGTLNLIRTCS